MYDLSCYTILAIDDEDDNLLMLESTLTLLHGAIVRVAKSAQDALKILDEFRPTTIVADLSMPNMDGFELLKVLRQRPDTKNLPVIAVTALAMSGDQERVLAAGFDGYISKPFEVVAIGEQIGCLVEAHRAQQAVIHTEAIMITQNEIRDESEEWSKISDEIH